MARGDRPGSDKSDAKKGQRKRHRRRHQKKKTGERLHDVDLSTELTACGVKKLVTSSITPRAPYKIKCETRSGEERKKNAKKTGSIYIFMSVTRIGPGRSNKKTDVPVGGMGETTYVDSDA